MNKAFKNYALSFLITALINISIFICNNFASERDIESLTKQAGKLSLEDKELEESKPIHKYTLSRFKNPSSPLIQYTQQLKANGETFDLNREETRKIMQEVIKVSNYKTFLRAQGVCMSDDGYWSETFNSTQNFLGAYETSTQKMAWVSKGSEIKSNKYYIRESKEYGGHAEPQFISDLEAAFNKNSDAVVKYFIPSTNNEENIYMCGLELFAPYDMCDAYNNEGNNKYDCIGKLLAFRKKHQSGQTSISRAIRDKLKDQFKGTKEDGFVVIYHANLPYNNVYTYKAEDEKYIRGLTFNSNNNLCQFHSGYFKSHCAKTIYQLSQYDSVDTEKDMLYGYIHNLADKKDTYSKKNGFSF